ncbi:MAG: hypothetical protein D6731_23550, partial [Planctomycetota bacterium]
MLLVSDPSRRHQEARLLTAWGSLLGLGVGTEVVFPALAEDLQDAELAAACRKGAEALRASGLLSSWVEALLGAPASSHVLSLAGQLASEELRHGWRRSVVWKKLSLLHTAGAPLGDGLAALAREARDQALTALAEGLYAGARAARRGEDLRGALLACAAMLPPLEAAIARTLADEGARVAPVLDALAALGDVPEAPAPPRALEHLAQAASESAAPLRRGLDRLLSGLEGALGRGPDSDRADAARRALAERRATPP